MKHSLKKYLLILLAVILAMLAYVSYSDFKNKIDVENAGVNRVGNIVDWRTEFNK